MKYLPKGRFVVRFYGGQLQTFAVATLRMTTWGASHGANGNHLITKSCLFVVFLITSLVTIPLSAQTATVAFYNVENLFDTQDDSLKQDEEFLPYGVRGWTPNRLKAKYHNLYKVIAGLGDIGQPPALVGLAEVENRAVLEGLLRHTPLHRRRYQIVHEESPDRRGIDVALLYDPAQFRYLSHEAVPVDLSGLSERPTRDILYVRGVLFGSDTVHCFINHWPSRYGGVSSSASRRQRAAEVLQARVHQLQHECPDALIVITGDFNDGPAEASMQILTEATGAGSPLINISRYECAGTHKYQGAWNTFDQFIVSANLLKGHRLRIKGGTARCYRPDWLAEEDVNQLGFRPKRTYVGYRYQGGFSDHWPVYLQLRWESAEVAEK